MSRRPLTHSRPDKDLIVEIVEVLVRLIRIFWR
jgi:hypothetical protein